MRNFKYFLFLFALILFLPRPVNAESLTVNTNLFETVSQLPVNEVLNDKTVKLRYEVSINNELAKAPVKGQVVNINLPGKTVQEAVIDSISESADGIVDIKGKIADSKYSYMLLSVMNGKITAKINLVEQKEYYTVTFDKATGTQYLNLIDTSAFNEIDKNSKDLKVPSDKTLKAGSQSPAIAAEYDPNTPATIDVMFVYTPQAKAWADSNIGSINLAVSNVMEESQLVLDNSNVGVTLRMVYTGQVDCNSTGSSYQDLYYLQQKKGGPNDPEGYMDEVHTWRDQYGADLVVLISNNFNDGNAGLGYLSNGMADYGFSAVDIRYLLGNYTVIHEMGHNLGCQHSRNQIQNPAPASGGVYAYSTGWRWVGNDGKSYCSVMTYNEGSIRVPLFSNPSLTWAGVPTGSYTGQYAPADNARSIREMKHVIAGYRLDATSGSQVVQIPDKNLQAAIREKLGKPTGDITRQDMNSIDFLSLQNMGIVNLSGLEYATNLIALYLDSNSVTDITPLSGLNNLVDLSLAGNGLQNISALSSLVGLNDLDLTNNNITDISPLTSLNKLESLHLGYNKMQNINSLGNIISLKNLYIDNNSITDITPLSKLNQLDILDISKTGIRDMSPLVNLTTLNTLNCYGSGISDVTSIAALKNLNNLYLGDNSIQNIAPLSSLSNLQTLDLNNNNITDIKSLQSLIKLQYLHLYQNKISNITALSGLAELQYLYLDNNNIVDISPLAQLQKLQTLSLSFNAINIQPLHSMLSLKYLKLDGCRISDIMPLTYLTNLESLELRANNIRDICGIDKLLNLQFLDLDANQIKDIDSILTLASKKHIENYLNIYAQYNYLELGTGSHDMDIINKILTYKNTSITYDPQNLIYVHITMNEKDVTLETGDKYAAKITTTPDSMTAYVKWYSSNVKIATVDQTGTVTAVGNGTAVITAESTICGYYDTCNVTVTLPAQGSLDAPAAGKTISGNCPIKGWFLDGSGVSKIEILVDGAVKGTAVYGEARTDVGALFPAYKNNNCGFSYSLDATRLVNGTHSIVIRETGNDGDQTSLPARSVTVYNLPTKGALDVPKAGQTISGTFALKGWFLDGSGVSKIEVLVDGTLKGTAAYGQARTDIGALFPDYKNSNCGYSYNLDTTKLTNGSHSIVIRETGNNGTQTSLAARSVTVANALPPKGSLDTPKAGQIISGISTVKGWFLDGRGVSKIEVLVDGTVRGTAAYGQARTDVGALFPDYKNNNCGYTYSLDTTKLTNGSHSIVIRETNGNGAQTSLSARAISVSNVLPAKGALDTPKAGQTICGTAAIRGWFLDGSGVAKIEVLVDGTVKGNAAYGSARTDIGTVFPDYRNTNCGFSYSLDTTKLTNGSHSIVIRETGANGAQTSLAARSVTVSNALPAKGALDTPKAGQTISGTCAVKGWFLDGSGVAKVEVLVDGTVKGTAAYGSTRTDIGTVFPDYKNTNCGFSYNLDTTKLTNGSHSIVIRETGINGAQTSLTARSVTVAN